MHDIDQITDISAIRVYVPKAVPTNTRETVRDYLASRCGGVTSYDGRGAWDSGTEVVDEPVTVLESVSDTNEPATIAKRCASIVKNGSSEDSVMWELRPVGAMGME